MPNAARLLATTCFLTGLTLTASAHDVLTGVNTTEIGGLIGPTEARGIAPTVLADVALADQGIASLAGRNLRTRFWEIGGDGALVPIHDHSNRPASLVVLTGEIIEHSSRAEEPFIHQQGGLALEEGDAAHWWRTEDSEPVHLIAFDVHQTAGDPMSVAVEAEPAAPVFDLPSDADATLDLLGIVDLGHHFDDEFGAGLSLSTYKAEIRPGGVLSDFTAAGEPLQVFVWEGSLTEHRSDAAEPLAVAAEQGSRFDAGVTGWWENSGDTIAVLYFGVVEALSETEGVPRTGVLAHGHHH